MSARRGHNSMAHSRKSLSAVQAKSLGFDSSVFVLLSTIFSLLVCLPCRCFASRVLMFFFFSHRLVTIARRATSPSPQPNRVWFESTKSCSRLTQLSPPPFRFFVCFFFASWLFQVSGLAAPPPLPPSPPPRKSRPPLSSSGPGNGFSIRKSGLFDSRKKLFAVKGDTLRVSRVNSLNSKGPSAWVGQLGNNLFGSARVNLTGVELVLSDHSKKSLWCGCDDSL